MSCLCPARAAHNHCPVQKDQDACWPKGSCSHRRRSVQAIVKSSMVEKTAGKKDIWYSNGNGQEQEQVNCKYKAKNARNNCRNIIATYALYMKGRGGWVFNR